MKNLITSYQEDLSNEKANEVLSQNGFKNVELTIEGMGHKFTGYGHRQLWAQFSKGYETISLKRTTTDMTLTDAWGDEEETVEGASYESQEAVMEAALDYILSSEDNQELLSAFIQENE